MNLPNKITLGRIVLAFVVMLFLFLHFAGAKLAALLIFFLACASDWADGRIARRYGQVTSLGKLMDPIADKVLVLAAFLAFVELRLVPAWLVVVIISRELLITGIRLLAASRGEIMAASRGGKHKVVSQMVSIVVVMIYLVLREARFWRVDEFINRYSAWFRQGILLLMILTAFLTLVSGFSHLWKNRRLLMDNVNQIIDRLA